MSRLKSPKYPRIRSKTKVIVEGGTENKTFSSLREDPITVAESFKIFLKFVSLWVFK